MIIMLNIFKCFLEYLFNFLIIFYVLTDVNYKLLYKLRGIAKDLIRASLEIVVCNWNFAVYRAGV